MFVSHIWSLTRATTTELLFHLVVTESKNLFLCLCVWISGVVTPCLMKMTAVYLSELQQLAN